MKVDLKKVKRCFDLLMQVPLTMYGNALFCETCSKCDGPVEPDTETNINQEMRPSKTGKQSNAKCKSCGRVRMPFLGYYPEMADAIEQM